MNKHRMSYEEFHYMIFLACHKKHDANDFCTPSNIWLVCTKCGKRFIWGEGNVKYLYNQYLDGCTLTVRKRTVIHPGEPLDCGGLLELILSPSRPEEEYF